MNINEMYDLEKTAISAKLVKKMIHAGERARFLKHRSLRPGHTTAPNPKVLQRILSNKTKDQLANIKRLAERRGYREFYDKNELFYSPQNQFRLFPVKQQLHFRTRTNAGKDLANRLHWGGSRHPGLDRLGDPKNEWFDIVKDIDGIWKL